VRRASVARSRSLQPANASSSSRAAIRVDRPHEEPAAALAGEGPFDLVVDYLWGAPAEAVFASLLRVGDARRRTRYVQAGMAAGEVAGLPALTLRAANVELIGSGTRGPAPLTDAAAAYAGLLQQVTAGEMTIDVAPVPLADVERTWPQAGGPRIVFVP
jgi:NADPH2:quinone reductase